MKNEKQKQNHFQELEWVEPFVACLPAYHIVMNVHRLEVCEKFYAEFSLLVLLQCRFFFLYCFSAGRNIRFKVKLNQSCSHTRNAISILGNQHRVCELRIRVQLVLLRSFQADKMAQMHHIKQWINAIFVAKIVLLFIAIQVVNVPTTSNMVNMGFGFFPSATCYSSISRNIVYLNLLSTS